MGVFIVNYILYWCYKQESNLQPSPCKEDTLLLSYCSNLIMAGRSGIAPKSTVLETACLPLAITPLLFYFKWMRTLESNQPNQAYETCQCPALFSAIVLFFMRLASARSCKLTKSYIVFLLHSYFSVVCLINKSQDLF